VTGTAVELALVGRDPILDGLIDAAGPCPLGPGRRAQTHFEYLARSICFQQLAGKAAAAIWGRARAQVAGPYRAPAVLALGEERLREAGLSGAKARSLLDLASRVDSGDLRLASIGRRTDDEIVAELCRVRGIGPWTAQMFLLFHLGRPDVWPVTDYGVRAGVAHAWGMAAMPTPRELDQFGEPFRPHRSALAWYAWRALDLRRDTLPTSR